MARVRHRGLFQATSAHLYERTRPAYLTLCAALVVLNGVIVSLFGAVVVELYLRLPLAQLGVFVGVSAAGFAVEGLGAAMNVLRATLVRGWGGQREHPDAAAAWIEAANLPIRILRVPVLYAIGIAGAVASDLVLAWLLRLPLVDAAWLFPMSLLLYLSGAILRYLGLELAMRPVLTDMGRHLEHEPVGATARVSLHRRMLSTIPMVTWGTAMLVVGFVTPSSRTVAFLGVSSLVALGVAAAFSTWLGVVLADLVSATTVDLRDATRRVAAGDLSGRVAVVSTDEIGELSAAFNTMVSGLRERAQLHEALGVFVDPTVAERVLSEGLDLHGEEIDVSILVVDIRSFTAFAEQAPAREVVAQLNRLYATVVPIIERHGGYANKFIGDGLLAVFGAPTRQTDHARRCVAAGLDVVAAVHSGEAGDVRIGIGVHSGPVVAGSIGGGNRRDFTVIGDTVNTAVRVEAATRVTGDDILVTDSTLRALGASVVQFDERPGVPLKGKAAPVRLYAPRRR